MLKNIPRRRKVDHFDHRRTAGEQLGNFFSFILSDPN